jgi:hypothetical protein
MPERSRPLCADLSSEAGEPLSATASRIDHWLLIEYPGLWSRDVLGGSGLTDAVKAHLRAQLAELPHSRLLFIRRPDRRGAAGRWVYVARTTEAGGEVRAFEIEGYEQLTGTDFGAVLRGEGPAAPLDLPLFVVCTHGKRDRCCARYGRPVYERLRETVPELSLWQSTHLGGDRFAGNLVCLPHGLYFGRVEPDAAWGIVDDYLAGDIALDHYRGRSCYSFPQQAAERAIRDATGLTGLGDLRLARCDEQPGGRWAVSFHAAGTTYDVTVGREEGELTYLTCDAVSLRHPRRFVGELAAGG